MHVAGSDDELSVLQAELEAAQRTRAEAEQHAAEVSAELRRIEHGLGWRALVWYRHLARKVAPEGSRRGHAYDLVVGTARRSFGRSFGWRGAVVTTPNVTTPPPPLEEDGATADSGSPDTPGDVGPPGADTWFRDHYDSAASRVVEFLAMDGLSLEGKEVADIGAGDGILDLGLVHKAGPARLVGFDLGATNGDYLLASATREGVCEALPPVLEFAVSGPTDIPAEDGSFDVVVSWSAFEHIDDAVGVLREARRIVRDDGFLFVQVWPFYHSQFGSHLRDWFPEGWEHLEKSPEEVEAVVRSSEVHASEWADVMLHEFEKLNQLTVDDLGKALVDAGFVVRRLNLLTRAVPVPAGAASRIALSLLGIEGVELTAVPVRPG